jgi:predicted glycoside hydrolase/deacetylase ChbG (UPF0249 family)
MLFVNADDLGYTRKVTDRILTCSHHKRIHSASAMTFMIDSERAAELAQANELPIGLHINFDQNLTAATIPEKLRCHHRSVSDYLKARKWNQVLYNPFLHNSFNYVFQAQWDEFFRLYGKVPNRLDGHHHMHLCMNMLLSGKLPKGIKIRSTFSFRAGEKPLANRLYRYLVDSWLKSHFLCTDFFYSIAPIDIKRIKEIVAISRSKDVEIMVHPGVEQEYSFLLSSEWADLI